MRQQRVNFLPRGVEGAAVQLHRADAIGQVRPATRRLERTQQPPHGSQHKRTAAKRGSSSRRMRCSGWQAVYPAKSSMNSTTSGRVLTAPRPSASAWLASVSTASAMGQKPWREGWSISRVGNIYFGGRPDDSRVRQ